MDYNIEELKKIRSKHADFEVKADWSFLDNNRKEIVKRLLKAADIIDDIYWKQSSHDALEWRKKYQNPKTDDEKLIHDLIEMNCGPYDRLNFYNAFIGDKSKRFAGAGFYPEDLTQKEFEDYVKAHPDKKELFESQFTVIKRKGRELEAVWYHDEYKKEITDVTRLLKEAAGFAEEPTLKKYLLQRAEDLQTDNYYKSDCAWIDLKDPYIDVVIGPYEVYADNLMGIKTGYEAVVMIKNKEETKKLDMYLNLIDEFEQCLPIDDKYKKKGGAKLDTPMIVVDTLYRGGEARRAMQFVAFSLPNDPKVLSEKGSKKVMHKNFQDARFNNVISPVCRHLLAEEQHCYMSAERYGDFIVLHEISHALGPRFVSGTTTPINNALKEYYSPMEELRADLLSVYCQKYLLSKGRSNSELEKLILTSYLASEFRSLRIGHGAYSVAATIVLNFCDKNNGVSVKNGKIKINYDKVGTCLNDLAKEVSIIEAEGDFARAKEFFNKYNNKTELVSMLTVDIPNVPTEVWPNYKI